MAKASRLISAKDLCGRFGLSFTLVSKILQRLTAAGVVTSVQGPKGGYSLARSPHDITLSELIQAVEGGNDIIHCASTDHNNCKVKSSCNIKDGMVLVNKRWNNMLNAFTLSDFMSNAGAPAT